MTTEKISTKAKVIMISCAVLMPIFLILPLYYYSGTAKSDSDKLAVEVQKQNTAPVGKLVMPGEQVAVAAPVAVAYQAPEEVYKAVCAACHDTGLLEAPKKGDQAAWDERIAKTGGMEGLIKQAIAGLGSMPPKGGANISDENFADVVHYISGHPVEKKADAAEQSGEAAPEATPAATEASTETATTEAAPAAEAATEAVATETAPATETAATEASAETATTAEATTETAPAAEAKAEVAESSFDVEGEYNNTCKVCHDMGVAGAPKKGDKAAWEAKMQAAGGKEAMIQNGIKGIGAMPARGMSTANDADFAKIVEYMME